jgi:S-adenosylmethionine hydrolase
MGYLEIAANRGTAAQLLGVGKGAEVLIAIEGAAAVSNGQ